VSIAPEIKYERFGGRPSAGTWWEAWGPAVLPFRSGPAFLQVFSSLASTFLSQTDLPLLVDLKSLATVHDPSVAD